MRIKTSFGLILGMAWTVALPAFAVDEFTCPDAIYPRASLDKPPAGWSAMMERDDHPSFLDGMTVYDGNPRELASLVPDKFDDRTGVAIWTFSPENMKDRRVWVACRYLRTTVILGREMPQGTKKCTATFGVTGKKVNYAKVKTIRCEQ